MKEIQLWPTSIYTSILNIDTTSMKARILDMFSTTSTEYKSNYGGWQSHTRLFEDSTFTVLCQKISEAIYKQFNIEETKFLQMWACVNPPGASNIVHTHGCLTHFSGVFYIDVPINSGNIGFRDPRLGHLNSPVKDLYPCGDFEYFIPEPNQLILFPSYLEHYVLTNTSNENRICLSVDLLLKVF